MRAERLAAGKPEQEEDGVYDGKGNYDDVVDDHGGEEDTDDDSDDDEDEDDYYGKPIPSKEAPEKDDLVPLRQLYGLDEIAFSAEAEFQGRKAGGSPEELTVRPWGFPRGGFRHQVRGKDKKKFDEALVKTAVSTKELNLLFSVINLALHEFSFIHCTLQDIISRFGVLVSLMLPK